MNDMIRQHKRMAGIGDGGASGVPSLSSMSMSAEHPDDGTWHEPMGDHERSAPIHHSKGKLPAQAHPDHGPHHFDGEHSTKHHDAHTKDAE